jgi:hypothetical protein
LHTYTQDCRPGPGESLHFTASDSLHFLPQAALVVAARGFPVTEQLKKMMREKRDKREKPPWESCICLASGKTAGGELRNAAPAASSSFDTGAN